ncbi:MAG TPA: riboflavin synthase [Polyangiaceae bacterium]|nr:riboflavin synthase [Polyangiaceae bacterium]
MFTGLVESVGKLEARAARGPGARLSIATSLPSLALGESIAVGGVCLTVDAVTRTGFEADASAETLEKTTLGALRAGGRVNLERALTLDKRLGGHIVTGHVDGVGALVSRSPLGEAERLTFRFPAELGRFIAPKGSITVDGISLTVNGVSGDTFDVAIIPRTNKETTIGDVAVSGAVNLEVDVLARYVLRMLDAKAAAAAEPAAQADKDAALGELLRKNGYM